MSVENSPTWTKEINDIIFHSGNQIPWYKRLPGERGWDSMAPERLFPSVSFSNLLLCFLCLFPSSRRGPVEPGLTGEERRGGGPHSLWVGGGVGEAVGPVTFFPLLFLKNQSPFKIMSLLIHSRSLFIGTYPPPPCQSG